MSARAFFPSPFIPTAIVAWLLIVAGAYRSPEPPGDDLPATPEQLGEKLFFDPILSGDRTVSCASCHKPEFAFADNQSLSLGVKATPSERNTPTATYMVKRGVFFWDGRAATLEEQALMPIADPREMNLSIDEAVGRLNGDPYYAAAFQKVFQAKPDKSSLATALARFQLTLSAYNSPFDRYMKGDEKAMSAAAIRGLELFVGKARCDKCHRGTDFSDDVFRDIGLRDITPKTLSSLNPEQLGRFSISKDSADIGKFKTPHLRNIAVTAPYMHDGSIKTLKEVIRFYNVTKGKIHLSLNLDVQMRDTVQLNEQEELDLELFLNALTDDQFRRQAGGR